MRPSDIKLGVTYRNRGKGRTQRTVLRIGRDLKAPWFTDSPRPDEPVVEFSQQDKVERLYLSSFASWAGSAVPNE